MPAPELVAVDPDGALAGAPAVLMTRLPGAVVWRPRELEPFLRGLAAALPAIHATPVGPGALPAYEPYALGSPPGAVVVAPAGGVGARRSRCFDGAAAGARAMFHPPRLPPGQRPVGGRRRLAASSTGPARGSARPPPTSGHCRWNLARRARARPPPTASSPSAGDDAYHPYWDVAAALGGYDAAELERKDARGGGVPRPRGCGVPLT